MTYESTEHEKSEMPFSDTKKSEKYGSGLVVDECSFCFNLRLLE